MHSVAFGHAASHPLILEHENPDLVRMECLLGPLRSADQIRLLAFRSFFSDCTVVPLHPEVMDQAAEPRASTRLKTADAIHSFQLLTRGKPTGDASSRVGG